MGAEKKIKTLEGERYPRSAAETRQRILIAAKTLFSRDVYRNIGTRDIAAEAGVNITLINRYFGSKKKLFEEAAMSLRRPFESPDVERERALLNVTDFLSEGDSAAKEGFRLALLSALDSEVSDIIFDLITDRIKTQAKLFHGDNRETRSVLLLASVAGIALASFLLRKKDVEMLDKEYIKKHVMTVLDSLYKNDAPE